MAAAAAGVAAPLAVLKDQLLVRTLDGFADVLPSAFDKENFAFYGTTLSGTPEQEVRWKRALGAVNASMGQALGQTFARGLPPGPLHRLWIDRGDEFQSRIGMHGIAHRGSHSTGCPDHSDTDHEARLAKVDGDVGRISR